MVFLRSPTNHTSFYIDPIWAFKTSIFYNKFFFLRLLILYFKYILYGEQRFQFIILDVERPLKIKCYFIWYCLCLSHKPSKILRVKYLGIKSNVFLAFSDVSYGVICLYYFAHCSSIVFVIINSDSIVLSHNRLLSFADNMKLFLRVDMLKDCRRLQYDIDEFVPWSKALSLSLNIKKCEYMTTTRRNCLIDPIYYIDCNIL